MRRGPGPTVVIDADGPPATMSAFEYLVAPPRAVERDRTSVHAHLGRAAPNRAGGQMRRQVHRAGHTLACSTTRPGTRARTTDSGIRCTSLPPGHAVAMLRTQGVPV